MTVLVAAQNAAIRLIGRRPSTIFSSTETFELELADLANEVGRDIADSADWQALTKVATLTGDGVSATLGAPTDYRRMLLHSDMIATTSGFPYTRITDLNAFLRIQQNGGGGVPGAWTLYGTQFHFVPVVPDGETVQFPYVDANIAFDDDGDIKSGFSADSDVFRLRERLLTLGIIWRWRQNKRLDYGEDEANFAKAFAEHSGRDHGSRIFATGPMRMPASVTQAYPWMLGP